MSDTSPAIANAEERQRRIEQETSVGKYTMKQIKQEGILIIGAVAGYFGAKGLMKNPKFAQWMEGKVATMSEALQEQGGGEHAKSLFSDIKSASKMIASFIGVMIGTTISGIVNTYEHWKNLESEKLAVAEINGDVGNLVNERAKFAETLNRQEAAIKELTARDAAREKFSDSLNRQENIIKDLAAKASEQKSFADQAATAPAPTEVARG